MIKNDWMLATDQWDLFRVNKFRHFTNGAGTWTAGTLLAMAVGTGSHGQNIAWQCASILFYERELPQAEILQVRLAALSLGAALGASRMCFPVLAAK